MFNGMQRHYSTFIDITRPVRPDMAVYPGNPPVVFTRAATVRQSRSILTRLCIGSHTGTHIDAPAHIHADGIGTAVYSLDQLNGPAVVVDVSGVSGVVAAADVPFDAPGNDAQRVLFKTANSAGSIDVFDDAFVALDESAARMLVERSVTLVGIDALSIKKRGVADTVHQILLDAGVVILEGLWLAGVAAGRYELLCLPLKVDLDGAPVRAVLRK